MWRKAIVALAFALAILCSADAQHARFPERTIKIVVPFPPGGSPDVSARFLAEALTIGRWESIDGGKNGHGSILVQVFNTSVLQAANPVPP